MSNDVSITLDQINRLSGIYPEEIILRPQSHARKRIFKYVGKFMCPVDEDLFTTLLKYNHIALPGVQLLGIGDQDSIPDLYRTTGDCWEKNAAACPYFLVFAIGPSGEMIGSLTNYKTAGKQYPVACLSRLRDKDFSIIGSSFAQFLYNLYEHSLELLSDGKRFPDRHFLSNQSYWKSKDDLLHKEWNPVYTNYQQMKTGIFNLDT